MPPHELKLKRGCVVMLLRNLNTNKGLCNGTRLIVNNDHEHCIEAEVITGFHQGDQVIIPKMPLQNSDTNLPFTLLRLQYPLRLAFSMTINKAQGQTFEKVGLYLENPVFAHGQLYVALSRARAFENIFLKIIDGLNQGKHQRRSYTKNVVDPFLYPPQR